jgi:hypothetical protein
MVIVACTVASSAIAYLSYAAKELNRFQTSKRNKQNKSPEKTKSFYEAEKLSSAGNVCCKQRFENPSINHSSWQ